MIFPGEEPARNLDFRVSEAVARINAEYGSLDSYPIHVYHQSIATEEYLSLLSLAEVLLITPERDTVTTIPMDYIACQQQSFGVPVITEFIGLGSILPPTFQVNQCDHEVGEIRW